MSLLDEIQDAAVSSKSDVGELLRRCMVLAAKLDNRPLEKWIVFESEGYPVEGDVPSYRNLTLHSLIGTFTGTGGVFDYPLQRGMFSRDLQFVWDYPCFDSAPALERLIERHPGASVMQVNRTEFASGVLVPNHRCIDVKGHIAISLYIGILENVRTRILKFVLELERSFPEAVKLGGKKMDTMTQHGLNSIVIESIFAGNIASIGNLSGSSVMMNVVHNDVEKPPSNLAFLPDFCSLFGHPT